MLQKVEKQKVESIKTLQKAEKKGRKLQYSNLYVYVYLLQFLGAFF